MDLLDIEQYPETPAEFEDDYTGLLLTQVTNDELEDYYTGLLLTQVTNDEFEDDKWETDQEYCRMCHNFSLCSFSNDDAVMNGKKILYYMPYFHFIW
jgi:hypothetical protein